MNEDWVECTLGEVVQIISGKNQKQVIDLNGKYPIYGSGGKMGTANQYLCNEGTTIIGRKGTINSPIYVNEKFWNVDTAFGLSAFEILDKRLLYFFSIFFNFKSLDKSTTIPSLAKRDLLQIKFPLPPLPIQRAIVRKIEELVSSLDSGIADLKKAQEQLVIYRQAVLKKAFEGEFEKVKLEDVSTAMGGFAFKSTSFIKEIGKYQVVRIGNVRPGLIRYDASPVYLNDVETKVLQNYLLKKGDVIITLTGTRKKRDYGFTTVIKDENLLLNQRLAFLRFNSDFLPKFFLYFSWSEPFKVQFFGSETGNVGQGNVGMKAVRETLVPFISLEEQKKIVREIESRLSVCDKVEESIAESLEKAKALRQSILKKAFEGKLLSSAEIARCKKDQDYEPAGVLLERIKKEKK